MAVATAAAVAGLAATGLTTGMSIGQAVKQKRAMKEANAAAAKSMAEARKRLDVNVYESLGIPKEGYELQREALLQQGQAALQAGMEGSQRGAAATAGRVQLAQQQGQGQVRAQMGQELFNLQRMTAAEEGRLADMGFQLDLEEAKGAQMAAGQAAQARQEALAGVAAGIGQLGEQAMMFAPLFPQNRKAQQAALSGMEFTPEQFEQFGNVAGGAGGLGEAAEGFSNLDFEAVGQMTPKQYRQFQKALTPAQRQMLFSSPQYQESYDPYSAYGGVNPFDVYTQNLMMMRGFNNQNNQNKQGN